MTERRATTTITPDNLPLAVREYLMRGQTEQAITTLVESHGKSSAEANQLIETYRQQLRERKLALDIQIMQKENTEDNQRKIFLFIVWGVRSLVVLTVFLLIWLLTK